VNVSECLFCIIKNDASRHLYSDDSCYVILDKYPAADGHLLIVSKEHHKNMMDAPDYLVAHMFIIAKKYFKIVWERLDPVGGSVITNTGPGHVDHFHVHIIPRYENAYKTDLPRHELTPKKESELHKRLSI
jgi:histidine triad (HIT) family protein